MVVYVSGMRINVHTLIDYPCHMFVATSAIHEFSAMTQCKTNLEKALAVLKLLEESKVSANSEPLSGASGYRSGKVPGQWSLVVSILESRDTCVCPLL